MPRCLLRLWFCSWFCSFILGLPVLAMAETPNDPAATERRTSDIFSSSRSQDAIVATAGPCCMATPVCASQMCAGPLYGMRWATATKRLRGQCEAAARGDWRETAAEIACRYRRLFFEPE